MPPQAKRRKVATATEEITFDPTSRHEFLTGFHKRKLQRTKQAQEIAEKKAREEKRQERKRVCTSRIFFYSLTTVSFSVSNPIQFDRYAKKEHWNTSG